MCDRQDSLLELLRCTPRTHCVILNSSSGVTEDMGTRTARRGMIMTGEWEEVGTVGRVGTVDQRCGRRRDLAVRIIASHLFRRRCTISCVANHNSSFALKTRAREERENMERIARNSAEFSKVGKSAVLLSACFPFSISRATSSGLRRTRRRCQTSKRDCSSTENTAAPPRPPPRSSSSTRRRRSSSRRCPSPRKPTSIARSKPLRKLNPGGETPLPTSAWPLSTSGPISVSPLPSFSVVRVDSRENRSFTGNKY